MAPAPPRKLKRIEKPAWHPLSKPLDDIRVALITSAAIREQSQRPFPRSRDASYRKISSHAAKTELRVDHRSPFGSAASKDPETVFPIQALKTVADQGLIGSVAPVHFSIYGGIQLYRDIEEHLVPALAGQLAKARVDLVVFIPY
jgi:D-proline reductase (dithiol) PrdB